MTQFSLIILHTNDIHGRVEGLARVATLVERVRAENAGVPVLYFDLGDVEEASQRLSNVTKGAGMHRLLSVAGCDAAVPGNGAWLRYGPQVVRDHAEAAHYPLLLANLRKLDGSFLDGTRPTALLDLGSFRLGLIGLSVDLPEYTAFFDISSVPALSLIREFAGILRAGGADAIMVLSHMGLAVDRELAAAVQGEVIAILGSHSHDLLSDGERIGDVWVVQAGQYAEHLGRIDLAWDDIGLRVLRASVMPVPESLPPSPAVLAEAATIEAEGQCFLNEVIGELTEPLDFASDRECGVADLMADVLLDRMGAQVAVVAAGQAFTGPLPAGPFSRGVLWDVCSSTANPALVEMTGAQLAALVARGLDPAYAAERPRQLRGEARGLIHLSGACVREGRLIVGGQSLDPGQMVLVAGTDWEFEPYGGYADPAWGLHPKYDVPTILREALEEYVAARRTIHVAMGRLG
jgi:2',3'-cyclic-nucleotide 2'-phosphodiesterase (5'-nucleotidase family)